MRTMERAPAVKRRRIYCGHCEEYLAKSAFYRHKGKYFDADSKTWTTSPAAEDVHASSSDSSVDSQCPAEETTLFDGEQVSTLSYV